MEMSSPPWDDVFHERCRQGPPSGARTQWVEITETLILWAHSFSQQPAPPPLLVPYSTSWNLSVGITSSLPLTPFQRRHPAQHPIGFSSNFQSHTKPSLPNSKATVPRRWGVVARRWEAWMHYSLFLTTWPQTGTHSWSNSATICDTLSNTPAPTWLRKLPWYPKYQGALSPLSHH